MTTAEPPTRVGELPDISMEAVRSVVTGSLFEMSPALEERFATVIAEGNQRMLTDEQHPGSESIVYRDARQNLQRLVQSMVEDATVHGMTTLDVENLQRALSWLCPLPPWC